MIKFSNLSPEEQLLAASLDGAAGDRGTAVQEKLERRFGTAEKRPWLQAAEKYRVPALIASWVCNVASGLGVFYLLKMIFSIDALPYLGWVVGIGGLLAFEWCKREASDSMWDHYFSKGRKLSWWRVSLNGFLFCLSMAATLCGVFYLVTDTRTGAEKMDFSQKPEAAAIVQQIRAKEEQVATIATQIKDTRADRSNYNQQGTFFYKLLATEGQREKRIALLEQEVAALNATLSNEYGVINVQNDEIMDEWKARRDVQVTASVIACFLLEILFETCMGFLSLFACKSLLFIRAVRQRDDRVAEKAVAGLARNGAVRLPVNGHPTPA